MSDELWFDAPQYVDIHGHNEEPPDDTYFDLAHPSVDCPEFLGVVTEREHPDPEGDVFFPPLNNEITSSTLTRAIRRSVSMGDLHLNKKTSSVLKREVSKYPSQEHMNRLAQPKRCASNSGPTLAEAVKKFQAGTPKRFRSTPSLRKNEPLMPWRATKDHILKVKTTEQPKFKRKVTAVRPFSFEMRDQMIQKKKEENVRRILEEEKKAREFHARPLPKAVLRSKSSSEEHLSQRGTSKPHGSTEDLQPVTNFRAKPALVLTQQPFIPKKDDTHCLIIEPFQLRTDERAEARQKFKEKLKEKELAIEAEKKAREEEARQLEEEMVAKLRKQMEFEAQPIKKCKEVKIETVRKFHTDWIRNKEIIEQ